MMTKNIRKSASSASIFPVRSKREKVYIVLIAIASVFLLVRNSLLFLDFHGLDMNHAPAEWSYDDVDYDNIAFSIIHHGVYAFDWDDPEWRSRFEAYNATGYYNSVLNDRHGYAPTTWKPPLSPLALAIAYKVFGTDFIVGRIVNLSFMSAAVFLAVLFSGIMGGPLMAILTALMIFIRPHPEAFAAMLMTESIATFILTATFVAFFTLVRSHLLGIDGPRRRASEVASGLLLGVLPLARSIFILWIPTIICVVLFTLFRATKHDRNAILRSFITVAALFTMVFSPWAIRNCIVSGHFNPLGSEGMTGLPGAYSDDSYRQWGQWAFGPFIKSYNEFEALPKLPQKAPAEHTYFRALHGRDVALDWIRKNPSKILPLMLMRVYTQYAQPLALDISRFKTTQTINIALFLFVLVGVYCWLSVPGGLLFALFILCDSITIAFTYTDSSRFLAPLIPVFGIASAGIVLTLYGNFSFHHTLTRRIGASLKFLNFSSLKKRLPHISLNPGFSPIEKAITVFLIATVFIIVFINRSFDAFAFRSADRPLSDPVFFIGDDMDYDILGFELLKHHSFSLNWEDQEWRSRFTSAADEHVVSTVLKRQGTSVTTFYPPLLPIALSIIYKFFGTGFALPKLFNLSCIVLALLCTAWFSYRVGGFGVFLLSTLFIYWRPDLPFFALTVFTEPLAILMMTISFCSIFFMLKLFRDRSRVPIVLSLSAGFFFGLLCLSRSLYTFWAVLIFCVIALTSFFLKEKRRSNFLRMWSTFFIAFIIVCTPWWIRNSLVTGHFYPLGSRAPQLISGGYSDRSYGILGDWDYYAYFNAYSEFNETFDTSILRYPAEYEYYRGKALQRSALNWIVKNPLKVPSLVMIRLYSHYFRIPSPTGYWPYYGFVLLPCLFLGIAGWWTRGMGLLFITAIAIDAAVIGIAYETGGVYLVPMLTILALTVGGMAFLPGEIVRRLRAFRERL